MFDYSPLDRAMSNMRDVIRRSERSSAQHKRKLREAHNCFFTRMCALKREERKREERPAGDYLKPSRANIYLGPSQSDLAMKRPKSVAAARRPGQGLETGPAPLPSETESEQDFLDLVQSRLNAHSAHQVSKKGFQFSRQEKREALAFKAQQKKRGKIENRNRLTSINKQQFKSIQWDAEADGLINRFILSMDLLANVVYHEDEECFKAREVAGDHDEQAFVLPTRSRQGGQKKVLDGGM